MKIGVITDCFKKSHYEGIKTAKRLGLDGVQIYATTGEFSPTISKEEKEKYKKQLKENGLEVSALCGDMGGYGFEIDKDNLERVEKTKAIVDLAVEFGSKVVTTHIGVIPEDKSNPRYNVMLKALIACGEYAKEKGVTLAIETGPEKAKTLLAFLQDTKGGVGVNLDPANFTMVTGQDAVEAVYILKDYIVHTHAKDGVMLNTNQDPTEVYHAFAVGGVDALNACEGFKEMPLGEGAVDWKEYIKALKDIGYDGYLTIERECGDNPEEDIVKAVDFLKNSFNMQEIIKEIKKEINFDFPADTQFFKSEKGLSLSVENGKVRVDYSNKRDILRAGLILKANGIDTDYSIKEQSSFDEICLMIDCSRNAVRNIDSVKKLIRILAMTGYNSLMLYTEDTYEIDGEPMFGYLRGRYAKEELKDLSEYADSLGIELIPCIQTLAHLNQLTRYKYSHFKCFDCSDILLVGADRTYELIENAFKTISQCFISKRIHIGMDEAWLLGRGVYLNTNGYRKPFDILLEHLNKVCEIAEKYQLKPIIWSDMFWHFACADKNCKKNGKIVVPEEILKKVPKNLTLCNWEYNFSNDKDYYEKLEVHKQFDNPLIFAGGTAAENRGFIPHLSYSFRVASAAIKAARKFGVKSIMETVWGDNGGECSVFSVLPAVMHYSYTANGVAKSRLLKEFKALTGKDFNSFVKIEYAQTFCGKNTNDIANPAKYGLYNDVFSGYVDVVIKPEDKENFKRANHAISRQRSGEYGYLFRTAYALNEVLYLKYDMGIRLRTAYTSGDVEELKKCAKDLGKIISKLNKFIIIYREQWLKENKPSGLEIQELRLGGLKERLVGCKRRLEDYLDGKVKDIQELQEKLLDEAVSRRIGDGRCDLFSHLAIASVNSFDGFTEVDV